MLVGALWSAILMLSIPGRAEPLHYGPVLLLEVISRSLWLAVYTAPRLLRGERG